MEKDKLKLTSSEIGTLWAEYVNGTAVDIVNRYMVSIIEDESIKTIFKNAIKTFEKQKQQIVTFMENEGFPVPIGYTQSDLFKGKQRLFTDIFCLNYLHIMTLHGLLGHSTSLGVSVREDLRFFYDSCDNDGKRMYHQTIDLLLEKGSFQRDPLFYPAKNPEYVSSQDFIDGFFGKGRKLAATEIISISFNLKKSIMAKTLSIAFSQVAQTKEVRKFLEDAEKTADQQIKSFSKIMQTDNLPVPKSWETEVTTSTDSPFSDKLMLYHIGFLFQAAQNYHGAGLASSMRTDLVTTYETTILKNLMVTKKWFNIMVQNKWLEQPPLAPNRKEIANKCSNKNTRVYLVNKNIFEKLMWSIALPGFGQYLNGKYFKGTVLLTLEFLINVQANFNEVILLSFHGKIIDAINHADYQWLMFYPCLYFFSMWDALKDAGGGKGPYSFLPYVFTAFFVTVGLIFSSTLKIFGVLFGPIWLPMLFVFPGVIIGVLLENIF